MENGSKTKGFLDLYQAIRDGTVDISDDCFSLLSKLHHWYYECDYVDWLGECIHMYLIRLRTEYPAVYAISIGQFAEFEEYIDEHMDPEGFIHLSPIGHGRFDKWRHSR